MAGWLPARDPGFHRVEIVAMDGFCGYQTAAAEAVPDAIIVMDPYHVVALVGHKLDLCRQRGKQDTTGHRGRAGDPRYRVRRTLRTRLALLTDKQETGRADNVRGAALDGFHPGRCQTSVWRRGALIHAQRRGANHHMRDTVHACLPALAGSDEFA